MTFDEDGSTAVLEIHRLSVIDSFQIFGPNAQPAEVRLRIVWDAVSDPVQRGKGRGVGPKDAAAFLGNIATARSVAQFSGTELGFRFSCDDATTDRGYARIGRERNGSFL